MKAPAHWNSRNALALSLLPLAWLFAGIGYLRRAAYNRGWLASTHAGVTTVIVGNINVGGSGKSPLLISLVKLLRRQGLTVGVVSRGYGGSDIASPQWVVPDSSPAAVGDEAVMLARRCECPVVVCASRVAAAAALLERETVDVLLSDDGLQHYALRRDIEIAVVDTERGLGNGWLMPAGPLREPSWRLDTVDFVVRNGDPSGFMLEPIGLQAVRGAQQQNLSAYRDQRVHAVAGIGNPQRFFKALRLSGMEIVEHAFADHHQFTRDDFQFHGDLPILMTEKDAVKCAGLGLKNAWYVPVDALLARDWSETFSRLVVDQVAQYNAQVEEPTTEADEQRSRDEQ